MKSAERYEIVREIGRGSSGVVYEARDARFDRRVALKTLTAPAPEHLGYLKREFRALADLVHPHLVELGELVVDDAQAFFTMELIEGTDAAGYVRSGDPEPGARLESVAGQTALGLRALHGSGRLHRDLKPSNVIVDRAGRARIADYGLVTDAVDVTPTGFAGSPAYAAPETLLQGRAGAEADCFALGVTLYELATGQLPFRGALAEQVLAKSRGRFARLVARTDVPLAEAIRELIDRLLHPNPAQRAGLPDVLAVTRQSVTAVDTRWSGGGALFGRDVELEQLAASLRASRRGALECIVVRGTSGMGKTALIERFVSTAAETLGALGLIGRCRPEEKVPHRALDAAFDTLTRWILRLPAAERAAVLDDVSPGASRLFPALRTLLPASPEPGGDPLEQRAAAVWAVRDILARAAQRRPLVLAVDDAQWAGNDDIAMLRAIASGPGAPQMLLLIGARDDTPVPLADVLRDVLPRTPQEITLAALPPDSVRALAVSRLGTDADSETLARVVLATRGNPFDLESAIAAFEQGGPSPASDVSPEERGRARLAGLEAASRQIVEVAALSMTPFSLELLARTLNAPSVVGARVGGLVKARLLRWCDAEGETVAIYHDRIRDEIRGALGPDARATLHGAVADALVGWSDATADQLVEHHVGARRYEPASRYAEQAAREAAARYAFSTAASFYRLALAHAPADRDRTTVQSALGDCLSRLGDGPGAAEHFLDAARASPAAPRLEFEARAASALLRSGNLTRGRDLLRDVLARQGVSMPASAGAALLTFLYWSARRRLPGGVTTTADGTGGEARLDALWAGATTLSMFDPLIAGALQARFAAEADRSGDDRRRLRALALDAAFHAAFGGRRRRRAEAEVAALRQAPRQAGWEYEHAWVVATFASTAWLAGDFALAARESARARALFAALPELSPYELALVDAWRVPALALVGDLAQLASEVATSEAAAESRGDAFALGTCRQGHVSVLWLARGDAARARSNAATARQAWGVNAPPTPRYHHLLSMTMTELYENRPEQACALIDDSWPALARGGLLDLEMIRGDLQMLRARARLWRAVRTPSRATRAHAATHALVLARWLERSSLAVGRPWAAALRVGAQVVLGRDRGAESVAERYAACGMQLHAALARGRRTEAEDPVALGRALLVPGATS